MRFLYIAISQIGVKVKCTFSLLTSRLQCLRRLYSLKPWVCVSVLLSDYWPSIRRRIKPLCLLCFFCLLTFWPVSAVRAQEPTPTNTLEPFYKTPTPRPDINYSCPDGIPEGWGDYEPDPTWLFHCSHCLPPLSEYDWGDLPLGWNDPPEGWPTVTPTPTIPEIPSLQVKHGEISIPKNTSYIYTTGQDTISYDADQVKSYEFTVQLNADMYYLTTSSTCANGVVTFSVCNRWSNQVKYEFVSGHRAGDEITLNIGQCHALWSWTNPNCAVNHSDIRLDTIMHITVYDDNHTYSSGDFKFNQSNWFRGTYHYNIGLLWEPGHVIPEIVVPDPDSYCDTVLPLGSGDDDDDNFSLPGFWFGDMQCFTLGGFDIPLKWLNIFFEGAQIVDWTMPGMQFCFQSIHFDNLTLFGLEINLDWIALAMGGVVLFRFLTRS